MHGKWCNSIHLRVNPSGEPEPGSLRALRSSRLGSHPRRGRQEARAARRAHPRPRWSTAASAAWRPPPWRCGPADPAVASASLLSRGARLRAFSLPTFEELFLPATPSASLVQLAVATAAGETAFSLPSLFPSFSRSLTTLRAFLQTSRGQIIAAQQSYGHSCSLKFCHSSKIYLLSNILTNPPPSYSPLPFLFITTKQNSWEEAIKHCFIFIKYRNCLLKIPFLL